MPLVVVIGEHKYHTFFNFSFSFIPPVSFTFALVEGCYKWRTDELDTDGQEAFFTLWMLSLFVKTYIFWNGSSGSKLAQPHKHFSSFLHVLYLLVSCICTNIVPPVLILLLMSLATWMKKCIFIKLLLLLQGRASFWDSILPLKK